MKKIIAYSLIIIAMASCSANKYLPEGEKYFEGHEIYYTDSKSDLPRDLEYELANDLKPESTRRYLISRPGVWLYQSVETEKKKGLKHFLKYKLGSKPIYLSELNADKNSSIISSKLKANGFFRSEVSSQLDTTAHTASAQYFITLGEPYYFDTLKICTDPDTLCAKMKEAHLQEPAVVMGELFRKPKLEKERDQISDYFKNDGYFYFVPGFTQFAADSNDGTHSVKLKLQLKEYLPDVATSQYTLKSATINLAAGSTHLDTLGDSLRVIIDPDKLFIKPKKLAPFIALRPGELYNKRDEEITLKQLNRLEVFEFVNIQFKPDTSNGQRILRATLLANPRNKHSLRSEVNVSTTSTNFTGPGIQGEYYNRNLFRGAEKLRVTATGRYEQQLSGSRRGLTSYEIDFKAALLIPRVGGIFRDRSNNGNVPSTKYEARFRIYDQPDYYAQSNIGGSYGYEWLSGNSLFMDLKVMNIDYVKLLRSSDRLNQLFEDGILLEESFNNQFIVGPALSVTYSPPPEKNQFVRFFFGGSIESAGNILYGAYSLLNAPINENGQYTLGNVPFAQYMRVQTDYRAYLKLNKYNDFVLRANLGLGIPYENSSALPFSKQFFVGGASSIRGFQPRSVGPELI